MKKATYFLTTMLVTISFAVFGSAPIENPSSEDIAMNDQRIEIYYFHNTHRCATCNAIEDVIKTTLKESYSTQNNSDQITFKSLDLGEESNKALKEKYEVAGPTLLFISNSEIVNLTNKAFMYARTKPEKFKKAIQKTMDKFLDLE